MRRPELLAIAALVAAGAGARLAVVAGRGSLSVDEACVAINVVDRPLARVLRPLELEQRAPLGFLLGERLAVAVLGTGDPVWRLLPTAASLAALAIAAWLAVSRLPPTAALVSTALVAFNPALVVLGAEAKPYAFDAGFTALLLVLALRADERPGERRRLVQLAAAGALAPWFAFGATPVLAAAGGALVWRRLAAADRRGLGATVAVAALWSGSVATLVALTWSQLLPSAYLRWFWRDGLAPLGAGVTAVGAWAVHAVAGALVDPLGLGFPAVGAAALAAGAVALRRRTDGLGALLLPPFAVAWALALARIYPFSSRLIAFLAVPAALLAGEGVARVADALPRLRAAAAATLAVVLLAHPAVATASLVSHGPGREDLAPVLASMMTELRTGDAVYVYYGAVPAFRFYARGLDLSHATVRLGRANRPFQTRPSSVSPPIVPDARGRLDVAYWTPIAAELDTLRGARRVWFVFSHTRNPAGVDELPFFLAHLDGRGTRLAELHAAGAGAVLYDLGRPPSVTVR